jgi:hypothetical protein
MVLTLVKDTLRIKVTGGSPLARQPLITLTTGYPMAVRRVRS